MKNLQKGFAIPIIIAVIALLAVGGGVYIYTNTKVEAPVGIPEVISNVPTTTLIVSTSTNMGDRSSFKNQDEQNAARERARVNSEVVACTMDAFQCPDGSWVGRTGPNCEFVCPTNNIDIPPPLGNSTLQIYCDNNRCNALEVKSTRSDFYVLNDDKKVKILIDIETQLRYVTSELENGVIVKYESIKKWAELYPLLNKAENTIGAPSDFINATIYGDWVNENTFKANWIKWGVKAD